MSAAITPSAPARLGRALQVVFSRGIDPQNGTGALYRVGARVVLEDAAGRPVDGTVRTELPATTAGDPPLVATYRPAVGDEIDLLAVLSAAQRQEAIALLTAYEALIAQALGLAASPAPAAADWQQARQERNRRAAVAR